MMTYVRISLRWRMVAKCLAEVVEALNPLHPSGRAGDQLPPLLAFAVVHNMIIYIIHSILDRIWGRSYRSYFSHSPA